MAKQRSAKRLATSLPVVLGVTGLVFASVLSILAGVLPHRTSGAASVTIQDIVQNVGSAQGSRYGAHDSAGNSMDTAKVLDNPAGGYLAVYHTGNTVKLATSTDILHWTYKVDLDPQATQPVLQPVSGGGFVGAWEFNNQTGSGGQARFRYYPSLGALYSGSYTRQFTAARTLSQCNEGTPNFYSITLNPDIDHSVIDTGFHYHNNCDTDRQARGTLTNFTSWSAHVDAGLNSALIAGAGAAGQTVGGNIGDRESIIYGGTQYNIHEVQYVKGNFGSWRPYLYNWSTGTAVLLNVKTKGGSTAFANPNFTLVKAPDGNDAVVVTLFVPSEGAATGETGELIYYREFSAAGAADPVIAAAGDIACPPTYAVDATHCQQQATSDLVANGGYTAVLTLGDHQYENNYLKNFQAVYDPSWGRVKSITRPAIGNHEYQDDIELGAGGYFQYFGDAATPLQPGCRTNCKGYYSYDIGAWHVVALNGNCTETNVGGCGAGSPQEQWLRADLAAHPAVCTMAVWHQARFSSGGHGSDSTYQPLWQALYDYHADVVLNGHDHDYERFAPQTPAGVLDTAGGIREFVVGTGGRDFDTPGNTKPNSEARNFDTFGVLKMTLHPGSYSWQFVPVTGGSFTDSGSANCVGAAATPTPAPKPGDINSDGKVDVFDLSTMLSNWGRTGASDINGDGKTDVFDLSILLSHWG